MNFTYVCSFLCVRATAKNETSVYIMCCIYICLPVVALGGRFSAYARARRFRIQRTRTKKKKPPTTTRMPFVGFEIHKPTCVVGGLVFIYCACLPKSPPHPRPQPRVGHKFARSDVCPGHSGPKTRTKDYTRNGPGPARLRLR